MNLHKMDVLPHTNELATKLNTKQYFKRASKKPSDDDLIEIISHDSTPLKSECISSKLASENFQIFPLSWVKVGNTKYCYFYKKEMVVKSKQNSESEVKKPFLRRASEIILIGLKKMFFINEKQMKPSKRCQRHHQSHRNTLYMETNGIDTFKGYSSTFESRSVDLVLEKILEKEVCRCQNRAINPEPNVQRPNEVEKNKKKYLNKSLDSSLVMINDLQNTGNDNLYRSADNSTKIINDYKIKAISEQSLNIHRFGRNLLNDVITDMDGGALTSSEEKLIINRNKYGEGSQINEKNKNGSSQGIKMISPIIDDFNLTAKTSKNNMKFGSLNVTNGFISNKVSECHSSPLTGKDEQYNYQGMPEDGVQFPLNGNKSNQSSLRFNFSRTSNSIKLRFKSILLGKLLTAFPAGERTCRCSRRKQRRLISQNAYSENNVPSSDSSLSMESCDLITMKHFNTDDTSCLSGCSHC